MTSDYKAKYRGEWIAGTLSSPTTLTVGNNTYPIDPGTKCRSTGIALDGEILYENDIVAGDSFKFYISYDPKYSGFVLVDLITDKVQFKLEEFISSALNLTYWGSKFDGYETFEFKEYKRKVTSSRLYKIRWRDISIFNSLGYLPCRGEGGVVSISDTDLNNGSPRIGDYICKGKLPGDQWLISEEYFKDNFDEISN